MGGVIFPAERRVRVQIEVVVEWDMQFVDFGVSVE